jgi:hypothetical protein
MRRHDGYWFAVPLLWLAACQSVDVPASNPDLNNPPAVAPLTLTRLGADSTAFALYSGVLAPVNVVVRDAAGWSALWQTIHATIDPMPPLPDVDFGQEMIVAAALGTRNSGGFNVLLTQANEDSGGVEIQVLETSPGADCFNTQALTQPIDLGRIERRDGPVRFVITQQIQSCGP